MKEFQKTVLFLAATITILCLLVLPDLKSTLSAEVSGTVTARSPQTAYWSGLDDRGRALYLERQTLSLLMPRLRAEVERRYGSDSSIETAQIVGVEDDSGASFITVKMNIYTNNPHDFRTGVTVTLQVDD